MPWDEDPDSGEYVPVRVYWHEGMQDWACRCYSYENRGTCQHLTRYRRLAEVNVSEEYL